MKFQIADPVPLPAEDVFRLIRDEMPKLVPFLQDVDRIEVAERKEDGDTVHLLNLWFAKQDKVPAAVRKLVPPEVFSWKDHASWTASTRSAKWRLEPRVAARFFECSGGTRIESVDAGSCKVVMDIDLQIHADKLPGVPSFLAGRMRPEIEEMVGKLLTPNLRNLAAAVRRYAEQRPR